MATTPRHAKNTKVLIETRDFSDTFRNFSVSRSVDSAESHGFGVAAKTFVVGIPDGSISLDGVFSAGTVNDIDPILSGYFGSPDTERHIHIGPGGNFVVGQRAISARYLHSTYNVQGSITDVVQISAEVKATGGVRNGWSLHDPLGAAETAIGNYTSVDTGAGDTIGGCVFLTVLANTMTGTTTIKAQTSTTQGGAYTDYGAGFTVPAATVASYVYDVAPGTTKNQWIRGAITALGGTGSITFGLFFGQ